MDQAATRAARLQELIRDVPDFPIPGIIFKDITPILQDPAGFHQAIEALAALFDPDSYDVIVGLESRGFVFGAPVAFVLNRGFVPIRKAGKLPAEKISVSYTLEYGSNVIEMHADGIHAGQRVLIVDDLLATGGTTAGTVKLVQALGAEVVSLAFLVELSGLHGRDRLPGLDVFSLLTY